MKFDPFVAKVIAATNFDNFTTSDVRSAFFVLKNDSSLDPVAVRRRIYADLLKLVKSGWLKKKSSGRKNGTRFSKTTLFDVNQLAKIANEKMPVTTEDKDDKQGKLQTKLNHYKAELLLNIGESEAYKELYAEHPDLITEIQAQFNDARDNNTRILGKIKAIEGLLKQITN